MMTTRQFYFSSFTGVVLMALGTGLSSQGVAGGGLFLVGTGILALAVSFRLRGTFAPLLQRITPLRREDLVGLPETGGQ